MPRRKVFHQYRRGLRDLPNCSGPPKGRGQASNTVCLFSFVLSPLRVPTTSLQQVLDRYGGRSKSLLSLRPRVTNLKAPSHNCRGREVPLTFSPLGPESPLRPGSPGGPCGRRQRDQSPHPRGFGRQTHPTPLTMGNVTHHGAGGTIRAWGSWETLFTLKHRDAPNELLGHPSFHLATPPPLTAYSPQGQESLEGHQVQASQGPPGDRWGQSSQEGLPSQLLPAGRRRAE